MLWWTRSDTWCAPVRRWRRDDTANAGHSGRRSEDTGARARAAALRARAAGSARPARAVDGDRGDPECVPAKDTAAPARAHGAAGGAPLHAPGAAQLLRRYRYVSARLVHDEVQPEGERSRRLALRGRASAAVVPHHPGRPRARLREIGRASR